MERPNEAAVAPELFNQLRQICGNHRDTVIIIEGVTNSSNAVAAASGAIQKPCSAADPCQIKNYISKGAWLRAAIL